MVFDQGIGMDSIRANLITPGNLALSAVHLIKILCPLLVLHSIEFRDQHLHNHLLILVLGTFVLALDHNTGRQVGDAHG